MRAVIHRYFIALDDRDFDAVAGCFAGDATAIYGGEPLPSGSAAITAELRARMARLGPTMHFAGTSVIEVEADGARAVTYAVAYVTDAGSAGAAQMRVRGLRYTDRLVREGGRWKIAEREHALIWASEVPVRLPA